LIGGGGEKVTLKIAVKHADEWNVWGDVTIMRQEMEIPNRHCAEVGRDPSEIKRMAVALLFLSDDHEYLERMRISNMQQPSIIGTVDEVRQIFADFEACDVDELIIPDFTLGGAKRKVATLDRFITDVAGR
jgi:alkanesulfonate monooxygenase SsuD/methylene tetrahydromethanopterin reductase-like flavin-dependent oxidoreductase (luciferase family)